MVDALPSRADMAADAERSAVPGAPRGGLVLEGAGLPAAGELGLPGVTQTSGG